MSARTIEIIVDVRDNTGGKLSALKSQLNALDKQAQRMKNLFKSFATLRLIDQVTAQASKINSLLKKIAGAAYRVTLRLSDGALGGIRKIESALMKISGKVYNVAVNVKGAALSKLSNLASGAAMAAGSFMPWGGSLAGGYIVGNAIKSYADFEKQMSKVQAITQLDKNSKEMQELTAQAKELGKTTVFTRKQVAEAQYYQALAGWSQESIKSATPHILNLASAGGIELGAASDMVTDAMTAFGLKATDSFKNAAGKITSMPEYFVDMMAKLQASSNTDLLQMREAIKYGAPTIGAMFANVKGQEGVQLRTEAARQMMIMIGAQANAGIKGSMAGTGVNTLFNRLAGGNRNTFFAERLLGLEHAQNGQMLMPLDWVQAFQKKAQQGMNVDDFYKVAEELSGEKIHADTRRKLDSTIENALKNGGKLGSEDIIKMSSMLAGLENAPKLMAMLFQDIDALKQKMTDVEGTADQMANAMMDNLAGSFTRLNSAWDNFQQNLMEGSAGDGLRNFVDALTEIINRADTLFKDGIDLPDLGKILGDVVGRLKAKFLELDGVGSILAGGALFMGLKKIATLAQSVTGTLKNIGKVGTAAVGSGLSAAQKVGTMTVSAGVVNINGRVNGAGGGGGAGGRNVGNRAIIDNYYATKDRLRGTPPAPVVSPFADMKSAAKGSAAFAGIFSMLDIMNVKAMNAERLANATPETRQQIIKENTQAEWQAAIGGLGSVLGAGLGGALGSLAGPMGTTIGAIVGGMIGDKLGQIVGKEWGENESARTTDTPLGEIEKHMPNYTSQDFSFGKKPEVVKGWDSYKDLSEQMKRPVRNLATITTQTAKTVEDYKIGLENELAARRAAEQKSWAQSRNFSPTWQGNDAGFDYYNQRAADMAANPQQLQWQPFSNMQRAEAAELNPEQMAQQAAMERGEFTPPEVDLTPLTENLQSQSESIGEIFSTLGEQISENLSSALEGAGEVFSTFGDTITEGLTSTFEGAGEIFATFGESISEGLAGVSEGAGEVFSNLSEIISSGMDGALSAATSSLEGIQNAFTSAKSSIESAWGELPGFFSGVFSGLGGAAASAGSAIAAGLTAPIGSVISAWSAAAAQISSIISSISASASAASASAGAISVPGHAEGGFITHPEIALIGEKGAELILPLNDRERSMELLSQASGVLGLNSEENISGGAENSSGGGNVSINLGGVHFEISAENPQEVLSAIKENLHEVTDQIAAQLSAMIQSVHKNQPLSVG